QRTPALAVVAVPLLGDVAAGSTDDVADRAGVVDVARGPALVGQQHGDVVTRRVVVAHQLVHERVPVAIAVIVDVAEGLVDPDVAGARIPAEHEILCGDGTAAGQQGGEHGGGQAFAGHGESPFRARAGGRAKGRRLAR